MSATLVTSHGDLNLELHWKARTTQGPGARAVLRAVAQGARGPHVLERVGSGALPASIKAGARRARAHDVLLGGRGRKPRAHVAISWSWRRHATMTVSSSTCEPPRLSSALISPARAAPRHTPRHPYAACAARDICARPAVLGVGPRLSLRAALSSAAPPAVILPSR